MARVKNNIATIDVQVSKIEQELLRIRKEVELKQTKIKELEKRLSDFRKVQKEMDALNKKYSSLFEEKTEDNSHME